MNKMMKILVAVFAVVLSPNLIGCGGDDSSDPGPNPDPTCTGGRTYNGTECVCPVGTWNGTSCTVLDTENPTVTLTSPSAGIVSGTITVSAEATDNIGVAYVEFKYWSTIICIDNEAPYTCDWDTTTVANGNYTVSARVYDAADNTEFHSIMVDVQNIDICATWRSDLDGRPIKDMPSWPNPLTGYLELYIDQGECWVHAKNNNGGSYAYSKARDVQYDAPPQTDGLVTMPWTWQAGTVTFKFQ